MTLLGWDIDGTLCRSRVREGEWIDPGRVAALCRPKRVLLETLRATPAEHVLVTGRTEDVRGVTESQVREWTGIEEPRIFLQEQWTGWDALREHKARALREAGVHCFIGDRMEDQLAAQDAGAAFLWAHHVARYGPSLLPGDARRRASA